MSINKVTKLLTYWVKPNYISLYFLSRIRKTDGRTQEVADVNKKITELQSKNWHDCEKCSKEDSTFESILLLSHLSTNSEQRRKKRISPITCHIHLCGGHGQISQIICSFRRRDTGTTGPLQHCQVFYL